MNKEPINILIVEDREAHIELARRAFESRERAFNVTVARTLKEARTQLAASTPDLMFVDLTLPDGSGIELLTGSEEKSLFPTIILTVSSDVHQAVGAIKAGALDYVIKSDDTFADLPHIAQRALREWDHMIERRRSEDKIRRQHDFFQNTIESLSHPFCVIDANDYTIKIANTASGFSDPRENVTCYAATHKRDKPCHYFDEQCPIEIVKATGKPAIVEHSHYDKSGSSRVHEVHAHPILDDTGNVVQVIEYLLDITERKRVEEALRESAAKVLKAQHVAKMGFMEWNLKTNEIWWSDEVYHLYGVDVQKPDMHLNLQLVHPEDREMVKESLDKAIRGIKKHDINHRKVRPDGKVIWVQCQAELIRDADGNPESLIGTVVDITARKKAEEARRESEEKFESFSENLPGVVCIYDLYPDGHRQLLYLGNGLEELLGKATADKIGKSVDEFFRLIHPDDLPKLYEAAGEAREAGQVFDHEYRMRVDSENYVWIRSVSQATWRENGIVRWSGQAYNITRQKEAEEELRESEEKYRQLFATETDAIMIFDAETRQFLDVNDAAVQMYGYSREEFLKLRHVDITAEPEASEDSIKKILSGVPVTGFARLHKKKDGTILPVEISGGTFILKGRSVLCGIVRDITERKSAEDALRISEERFYKAFNSSPDAIVLCSLDGPHPDDIIFVDVNESFEKLSGYSREEVIGKRTLDVKIFWDDKDQIRQYELLQKYGRARHEECVFRSKSGDALIGDFSSEIFYIAGKPYGVIVVRDITASKAAEEALRESESRYRELIEESGLAILIDDLDGNFIYFNDTFAGLFGYGREEMQKLRIQDLVYPDDLDEEQMWHRNRIRASLKSFQYDLRAIKKDGSIIHLEINFSPIKRKNKISGFRSYIRDITEKKRAEEALIESEEKYRQLFTTEMDAIVIFDAETRQFVDVNDAAVQMYGYSREEFLKLRHVDITAEPEASEDSIEKILSGAPVTGITRLHKKKDGTILPVEISSSTFILKGRSVLCGIVRDITERKSAEDALHISEERFYKAFNSSPDAIVLCSLDGPHPDDIIFVNVNESFEKITGYSREEVIGKRTLDVKIFWDDKDQIRQYELLQKYGRVRHEECVFRSKSGDALIGDFSSEIFYIAGKLYGVIVVRDITASKAAEEALRESEEKYKGLVENIEIGISLISPQMEILSLNRKMQEWFPTIDPSKKPVCYESYNDPPKTEVCSYCPVARTLKDGNVHDAVSETPAGDETKNYRIVSSPVKDVSGNVVAVIEMVEDVTEKLKLEKERERAVKLESIGILAGGIAHDFNNILAGLLGSISRAKMDINPKSETYKALERAEMASIRAERLTDQLLTFSKGGAPVKEKASVAELVRDTAGFALSGSNVGCEFLIPDDTWEATVDRGQISQVVQNLVINATQAMPDGGQIKISVQNLRIGTEQRLPLQKGKYVKISVRDKGIGIPDDYLQKIFDPYFTTKQKGSGLGLATVYSIVKNHDGYIDVTSELGVGTTFDVYLPSTGKVPSKERISEAKIVPGTGKVLVMDDEEIIRITLGDILTKIGYEVKSASDGQEAIELFKNEKDIGQPFDIVILDLTIPGGMGGKEAIVELREIDPDVKAIVSSGYATDPVVATFKEHGFSGYLKKPYKASDLSMVLGDILRGESGG